MITIPRLPCLGAMRRKQCAAALLVLVSAVAVQAKTIPLSDEERLWITEHPVIAYGFEATGIPYAFLEEGRHKGLDADLLALLGRKTGLRFAARTNVSLEGALERVRAGMLPMVSFVAPSARLAPHIEFTDAAMTVQYGIFTGPHSPLVESAQDLAGKRVAVRASFLIEPLASASHDIVIVPYPDVVAALQAVAAGDVDATVAPIATGAYIERTMGVSRVVLQAVLPETYPLCFGVDKEQRVLRAILDKALSSVSPDEMRALKTRWLVGEPTFTREELIATVASTAAAILLLAGLVVSWLYRRLRLQYERLAAFEDRLRELATIDDMSGLGNRRSFNEALAAEVKRADRQSWPVALLELDLDYFKLVNDLYGHEAGDAVIAAVGQAIRSDLRVGENAYRVGGEEFAVILPDTDADGAYLVAERIRAHVENLSSLPSRITASVGIAVREPGSGLPPEKLFSHADRSLYDAKAAGRNCVRIAAESTSRQGMAESMAASAGNGR